MTGTAIKTNGEKQVTTSHLNLKITLAEAWRRQENAVVPRVGYAMPAKVYASAAEMRGAALDCRMRLMGGPVAARLARSVPDVRPVREPIDDEPSAPSYPCPVNMLALPSWKFLRAYVAAKHGVGVRDIESRSRRAPVVKARNELCSLMHTHLNISLCQIGALLKRDHTTVLYSISTHRAAMEKADA